ncbi:hypothetical protein PG994_002314 [Apiospora phragmitis]|uniref:Uncharacterized protein n=1 Tax=Apiospora phragmitis TaxID=2905665 RepID=A0ABR1WW02_9PEZI
MEDDPYCSDAHQNLWQKREHLHGANFFARWTTHLSSPPSSGAPSTSRDGGRRTGAPPSVRGDGPEARRRHGQLRARLRRG